MISFEAGQYIATVVLYGLKVSSPDTIVAIGTPNQITIISEDVWASLSWTVLLMSRVYEACERANKQIP